MPVPLTPPWRIYDDLGPDATRDLIRWFNEMQAIHRAEIRAQEDRIQARMDAAMAIAEARMERRFSESDRRASGRSGVFGGPFDDVVMPIWLGLMSGVAIGLVVLEVARR